jgi:cystathionine beta-lyase/cystathionine gamma-synthase
LAAPIQPTSVWQCLSAEQADGLLGGAIEGYVYQRDGHPNADSLCRRIAELHQAERTVAVSSGMAALAAALLSQLGSGDHLVVSDQLYGRSSQLFQQEAARLDIAHTVVDACDLNAVGQALQRPSALLVVETLANPRLRCANLPALAEAAHQAGALLLVDNTFATPVLCQPLRWGADLVMESVSKMMNGHSDVMLGTLSGHASVWERVPQVVGAWGMCSSPFDCWLAERGLATLPLRMARACDNAALAAELLSRSPHVTQVDYPGLPEHADHELAKQLCSGRFGSIVTFHIKGGRAAAEAFFLRAAESIPFCPSLGEICTTVSHPESTSHRGLTAEQRQMLGITGGTLRLSLGIEAPADIEQMLQAALG